jgi:RNA polymerase sigma-54 factor
MNIHLSQSLQLKQTLKLNQVMIQRFNILQQSSQDFEATLIEESKRNPFVFYSNNRESSPYYSPENEGVSPIDFATYDESLLSVLTNQLDRQFLSEKDYQVVLSLIDACDDYGFIKNYKDIRPGIMAEFGIDEREVFRCLKILQSFEPDGVGARSINECLWIQIDHYDLDDANDIQHLKELVKHHLEDISAKNYEKILDQCGMSYAQLMDYIEFISKLNPNPAAAYSKGATQIIEPSLRVECDDGVLSLVNLETERMSISLNADMLKKLEQKPTEEMEKQLAQAKVWVEHFKKRQELLQRCGEYLLDKQRLYFLEGDAFVLPCLQKDMARHLDVSESTISRLVRTKYIQSNHGVHLFQSLCQRNIYGKTKDQVRRLVKYYCEAHPHLSDQKLAELLKSIGLPIARRTVTKYRHGVSLSSSYDRKKKSS